MAGRTRKSQPQSSVPRWLERVSIAALAAVATASDKTSVTVAAITIFLVLVGIEELGKRWVWRGRTVTLRDVALSTVGELRVQLRRGRASRRKRKRRTRSRKVGGGAAVAPINTEGGAIQE